MGPTAPTPRPTTPALITRSSIVYPPIIPSIRGRSYHRLDWRSIPATLMLAIGGPGGGAPADPLAGQPLTPNGDADAAIPAAMKEPRARKAGGLGVHGHRLLEHRLQRRTQGLHLLIGELVGGSKRGEPGLIEDLVRDPIPHPGRERLIEQDGLER